MDESDRSVRQMRLFPIFPYFSCNTIINTCLFRYCSTVTTPGEFQNALRSRNYSLTFKLYTYEYSGC